MCVYMFGARVHVLYVCACVHTYMPGVHVCVQAYSHVWCGTIYAITFAGELPCIGIFTTEN